MSIQLIKTGNSGRPALAPGQVWKRKDQYYVSVNNAGIIVLLHVEDLSMRWSNCGFGDRESEFTFVGNVKYITVE